MDIRRDIEKWYPNIVGKPYKVIKVYRPVDNKFNCVSFTLDITTDWMWTNESIWPRSITRDLGIDGFIMLYELHIN